MPDQTIKCPKCGNEIPLTEALTGQIEKSISAKYEAEAAKKAQELEKEKQGLRKLAQELEEQKQFIDQKVAEQVKAKQKIIAEQEKKKVLEEQAEEKQALQVQIAEQQKKISEAGIKELEFLKKQQELEQAKENIELEVQRKITEERKKIAEEAGKKASEEQMLKMREKDDQLAALKKQIDELKRKSETGSQEAQGEALEGQLFEYLERAFPFDKFEDVKKGQRGADILQIVRNSAGKECGKILWESKNTKAYQKGWIEKLKNDQMEANANIAVIMSMALPDGICNFGQCEGLWITDYKSAVGLATALRCIIIEAEKQRVISGNQENAKDLLYEYITSQEFVMKVRAVVDAFTRMLSELDSEKRAMGRIWSSREKQIMTVIENVTGFYGSIEGLVGGKKALPEIKSLSLEAVIEEEINEN